MARRLLSGDAELARTLTEIAAKWRDLAEDAEARENAEMRANLIRTAGS